MAMARIPAAARPYARPLGLALLVWGLLGMVLIALVAVSIEPTLAAADALAENETAADIQGALDTTVVSLDGVGTSVAEGRRAAQDAGTAVREIAATTEQLAQAMSLSIFGAQPFLSIAQGFERQTTSLEELARDLDALTAALRRNETDVAALRQSAFLLRERVDRIVPASTAPASDLRPLIYALLAWLALPALGAIGAGAWLLRSAPLLPAHRRQAA
jgi:hypothetical protein